MQPQDDLQDPMLKRWLEVLNNNRDEALARALFAEGIVIDTFPTGKGGGVKRLVGMDEVLVWLRRPKPGLYLFEALSSQACPLLHSLPSAERAVSARYRVSSLEPGWTWNNHGDWVLHISGQALTAIHHEPEALLPD